MYTDFLPACMSVHHVNVDARKGFQMSLELESLIVVSHNVGAWIQPGSSVRAANTLNSLASSV